MQVMKIFLLIEKKKTNCNCAFLLGCYKESADDIDRALQQDPELNLKATLLARRGDNYSKLETENLQEAKYWLLKAVPPNDNSRRAIEDKLRGYKQPRQKIIEQEAPKFKSRRNKKYHCASDAIDVKYTKKSKRGIMASKDIEIGEDLIIEKPYFAYLDPSKFLSNCSYCLATTIASIPCDECVNSLYCSEACKSAAWEKYHRLECPVINIMKQYEGTTSAHSVRFLMQIIQEAGGVKQLRERLEKYDECEGKRLRFKQRQKKPIIQLFYFILHLTGAIEWPLKEELYRNCSLDIIYHLLPHANQVSTDRLQESTLDAARIMFLLATYTKLFFGVQYSRELYTDAKILRFMLKDPDVMFLGGLLIRIDLVLMINSFLVNILSYNIFMYFYGLNNNY